ncbi:MAG: WD40 repeat domain-containing protein [Bacteroidota bacterium]
MHRCTVLWLLCLLAGLPLSAQQAKLIIPKGHSDNVENIAFSPSGRYLVTGGDDLDIKVWDYQNGHLVRTISFGNTIYDLAVSPDGRYIAVAGKRQNVRYFELKTGKRVKNVYAINKRLRSLAFLASKDQLFGADTKIYFGGRKPTNFVDSGSGRRAASGSFKGAAEQISRLQISRDGAYLLGKIGEREVALWSVHNKQKLWSHKDSTRLSDVALSPDGRYIAATDGLGIIQVWENGQGDQPVFKGRLDETATKLLFHPNSSTLLSAEAGVLFSWDVKSLRKLRDMERRPLGGKKSCINEMAFSKDGSYLGMACGCADNFFDIFGKNVGDNTVEIRSIQNFSIVRQFAGLGDVLSLQRVIFSEENNYLIWQTNQYLNCQDLRTGKIVYSTTQVEGVEDVFVHDPTQTLVLAYRGGKKKRDRFEFTNLKNSRQKTLYFNFGFDNPYGFVPNRSLFYGANSKSMSFWDLERFEPAGKIQLESGTAALKELQWTKDGQRVGGLLGKKEWRSWSVPQGEELHRFAREGMEKFHFDESGEKVVFWLPVYETVERQVGGVAEPIRTTRSDSALVLLVDAVTGEVKKEWRGGTFNWRFKLGEDIWQSA